MRMIVRRHANSPEMVVKFETATQATDADTTFGGLLVELCEKLKTVLDGYWDVRVCEVLLGYPPEQLEKILSEGGGEG